MAIFLLDTCVIIDALNNKHGRPALLLELLNAGNLLACCSINIAEVYAGMRPREAAATDAFLDSLHNFPITPGVARMAGLLKRDYRRRGVTLNLGDAIIAAVAIHNRVTLLTGNVKDFPMADISLYPMHES